MRNKSQKKTFLRSLYFHKNHPTPHNSTIDTSRVKLKMGNNLTIISKISMALNPSKNLRFFWDLIWGFRSRCKHSTN